MELRFEEMTDEEIRPGDLVFVLAREDDGLELLVAEVNGTHWCHVGIACGGGLVASARCDSGLLGLEENGGARLDPLSWYREELGRHIIVGRVGGIGGGPGETEDVRFAPRREAAARFGRLLTAEDHVGRTRFSFSKTILAGIARKAADVFTLVSSDAAVQVLDAVDVVAEAWAASPRSPTFSAAEFVATAYGLPLTRAALQAPIVVAPAGRPEADLVQLGHRLIREQEPAAVAAFAHVLDILERHEERFLRPTVEVFGDWWRGGEPAPPLVPAPRRSPRHEQVPGSEQPIGAALMSARTLEHAWWVEELLVSFP